MDYNAIRFKVNELNRSAIKLSDMIAVFERGELFEESLTAKQIAGLATKLKAEADSLKTIAGAIRTLVG